MKITWEDFNYAVRKLAREYKGKGITEVVGISRGGLPLAVALSHELGVPLSIINSEGRPETS